MIEYDSKTDKYNFEKKEIHFFISIGFVITKKCNQNCFFCCEPPTGKEEAFSIKKAEFFVKSLAAAGLKKININGGEPLLEKNLFPLLKIINSNGVYSTLATNGQFLNQKLLKEARPFLDNIRFTLLGKKKPR